jgi:hypothetical protein
VILAPYETLGLVIADKRFGLRVEGENLCYNIFIFEEVS